MSDSGCEKTRGHIEAELIQARLICDTRARLGALNPQWTDEAIWQKGLKIGPTTPAALAENLIASSAAADEYADALTAELGLSTEPSPEEVERIARHLWDTGWSDRSWKEKLRILREALSAARRSEG